MKNELLLEEIETIKNNEYVVFSTSCNNNPRSIVVMPSRIEKNRMILSNIQMDKTFEYCKNNSNVFINVYIKEKNDLQFKIDGKATILENGELFNEIKDYEETNNLPEDLKVRAIIVVEYENIEVSEG